MYIKLLNYHNIKHQILGQKHIVHIFRLFLLFRWSPVLLLSLEHCQLFSVTIAGTDNPVL
jgi:hypothetical protein